MNRAVRLERAVVSIYPEIQRRITSAAIMTEESLLWKELSCCILSSQVNYPVAVSAAELLERCGLLAGRDAVDIESLEAALKSPILIEEKFVRYRFPKSKARQIRQTHDAIHAFAPGLRELLDSFSCGEEARRWFVSNAAGLGPKQASMFLRNTGMTYDLAVLDRHVMDYMSEIGLGSKESAGLSSLNGYAKCEMILKSYARDFGMAVGLLDWAIWIVMRVFKSREVYQ